MESSVEKLHPALRRCYEDGEPFAMVRHPLVFAVPFFDHPEIVENLNRQLALKRNLLAKARKARDWSKYVYLHERPYRVIALSNVAAVLTDELYWPLVADVWCDTEFPCRNDRGAWLRLLGSRRDRRELFTPEEDREAFAALPERLEVFRGAEPAELRGRLGLSWTLDRDRAQWFADRFAGGGVVLGAEVYKADAVGYIDTRGEREVVVVPNHVRKLRVVME